jgi:hypothetical protein
MERVGHLSIVVVIVSFALSWLGAEQVRSSISVLEAGSARLAEYFRGVEFVLPLAGGLAASVVFFALEAFRHNRRKYRVDIAKAVLVQHAALEQQVRSPAKID